MIFVELKWVICVGGKWRSDNVAEFCVCHESNQMAFLELWYWWLILESDPFLKVTIVMCQGPSFPGTHRIDDQRDSSGKALHWSPPNLVECSIVVP